MNKIWWKESVMYQIYPRSYMDSNGDGIGDLNGITSKLDYIKNLGIDIIWMSPIFSSPNADNGYDISDFRNIMTDFGTMDDFDILLKEVHARDMKLLLDIVLNHSSDQHEWFKESRSSMDNPKRDYYFWRPEKNNWQSVFKGSVWEHDELTKEYYLHYFLKEQPDLNWENPKVRKEFVDILRFWLDKGVDGFRLDVIPFISKRTDFEDSPYYALYDTMTHIYANGPRLHEFLNQLHTQVWSQYDCFTVGEGVGIPISEAPLYVDPKRKELHTIYHFDHFNLDTGPGGKFDIQPVDYIKFKNIFYDWDKLTEKNCWNIIYLGNHDLGRMLTRFGSHDYREASAKLLNTILLTLRGTPIIYMGDELGMTNNNYDNVGQINDIETKNNYRELVTNGHQSHEDFMCSANISSRDHARTPMPWTAEANAGFTTHTPWISLNPNYTKINAAAQVEDPNSVYNYCARLIKLRRTNPVLIYGTLKRSSLDHDHIFAYHRSLDDNIILTILNLSSSTQKIKIDNFNLEHVIINNYKNIVVDNGEAVLKPWQALLMRHGVNE